MSEDPAHDRVAPAPANTGAAPAATRDETDAPSAPHGARRAVQRASGWVLIGASLGIGIGLLWVALAPRVTVTVAADGVTQDRGAASVPFDADLLLGGLLLATGIALAMAWLVRGGEHLMSSTIGMVLGGLLAGGVAVTLAGALTGGLGASIADLPQGTVAEAPLRLRSWPMLLWWPAAVLVVSAVSSLRSESERDQSPVATPTP